MQKELTLAPNLVVEDHYEALRCLNNDKKILGHFDLERIPFCIIFSEKLGSENEIIDSSKKPAALLEINIVSHSQMEWIRLVSKRLEKMRDERREMLFAWVNPADSEDSYDFIKRRYCNPNHVSSNFLLVQSILEGFSEMHIFWKSIIPMGVEDIEYVLSHFKVDRYDKIIIHSSCGFNADVPDYIERKRYIRISPLNRDIGLIDELDEKGYEVDVKRWGVTRL